MKALRLGDVLQVEEADAGAEFGEGHELDAALVARVLSKQVGRMLTIEEAERLLRRLEAKRDT